MATELAPHNCGSGDASGTFPVNHVGAPHPLAVPGTPPPLVDDAQRRISELERELGRAREEIRQLLRERDELRAAISLSSVPLLNRDSSAGEALDVERMPRPAGLPRFDAAEASSHPALSLDAATAFEPPSFSRLVVSKPPSPPAASAPPITDDSARSDERPSDFERRQRARLGCEFEVEFLDDTHLIAGLSQDISEGGVFVATYQKLVIGSTVSLGLELPGGRVEVRGQVRWERGELEDSEQRPGYGVAFTELSPQALAALTELFRTHPAHYYDM